MNLFWVLFILYILDDVLSLGIVAHFTKKGKTIEVLESQIWALQEQVSMLDKKLGYHAEHHNPHGHDVPNAEGFTQYNKINEEQDHPEQKKWMSWDEKRNAGLVD